MNYNDLKRKYVPRSEQTQQEPPRPTPTETPVRPAPQPEPVTREKPVWAPSRTTAQSNRAQGSKAQAPAPAPRSTQQAGRLTPASSSEDGFFGGNQPVSQRQRPVRQRVGRGFSWDWLANVPWLDVVMILLTVIGIVSVIVNFDAVTLAIASVIAFLLQKVVSLFLIIALIVGAVLLFTRRRRFL